MTTIERAADAVSPQARARLMQDAVDDALDFIAQAQAQLDVVADDDEEGYRRAIHNLGAAACYAHGRLTSFRST